ncbi:MAG: hypothetical protein KKD24_05275 [Proteobacteria bacterium]|nr:hypothetical protein [Pseudomonadota bacterium]
MTKDIYLNFLGQLLREHYNSIKETGSVSSDSQQFINGYLTAARKLNAVFQKELNDYTDRIHYEVFNMTIEQRKKSLQIKPDLSDDELENPVEPSIPEDAYHELLDGFYEEYKDIMVSEQYKAAKNDPDYFLVLIQLAYHDQEFEKVDKQGGQSISYPDWKLFTQI